MAAKREAKFTITAENKTGKAIGTVSSDLAKMRDKAAGISASFKGIIAGAVTFAGIKVFSGMVKESADFIDQMDEQARRLGISIEAMQRYRVATKFAGAENEDLEKSLLLLNKNIGNLRTGILKQDGGVAQAFERVGVSMEDLGRLSNEDIFDKVTAGLAKIPDQATRTATAMQIFGKGAGSMMLLFNSGADEIKIAGERIEDLGIKISQLDANKIGEMNDRLDELGLIADGAKMKLAAELAPAVEVVSGMIVDFIKRSGGAGEMMGSLVANTVNFADRAISVFGVLSNGFSIVKDAVGVIYATAFQGLTNLAAFVVKTFTVTIPSGINEFLGGLEDSAKSVKLLYEGVVNGIVGVINAGAALVVQGVERMVNAAGSALNPLIDKANSMNPFGGKIPNIAALKLDPIKIEPIKIDNSSLDGALGRIKTDTADTFLQYADATATGFADERTEALNRMTNAAIKSDEALSALMSSEGGKLKQEFEAAKFEAGNLASALGSGDESSVLGGLNNAAGGAKKLTEKILKAKKVTDEMAEAQARAVESYGYALSNGISSAIDQMVDTGKVGFKELTASILRDIAKIMAKQAVLNAMMAFGGSGSSGSSSTSIWASVIKAFAGSYDGGGFTGSGSRSGGIDGKGGFPAILHPNETVVDHTKGQQLGGNTVNQTVIIRETMESGVAQRIISAAKAATLSELQQIASRGGSRRGAFGMA